ncbi:MAG: DUF4404 family protein [Gammaproteobacteria bacterium]|nr:DUF4404 family protein [Gammaproteobacteria bacterium]
MGFDWKAMDKDRLQSLLAELHQELGRTDTLDADSRRLLLQVLEDARVLASRDPGASDEPDANGLAALQEAALELQSSHPRLALLAGQVADSLAKLGI